MKSILIIQIILLLSLAGSLAIYFSTSWGPWAYSDSAGYISSARNLLAGNGLGYFAPSGNFKPLSIHPPLYPLVLSAIGLFGIEMIEAARWLNIVLFGVTIFLSGALTYSLTHSSWLALSLSATLHTMPSFLNVSSGAMSELIFFFTSMLGICMLVIFLERKKRYQLILSSVSIGLAFLTRFNAVVLVIAGIIGLLINIRVSWKQRILDITDFCLISITPTVLWLIRTYTQTGTLAARHYNFDLNIWSATAQFRVKFIQVFSSWLPFQTLLPTYSYNVYRYIFIIFIALILLMVCLVVYKKIKSRKVANSHTPEFSFALFWIIFSIGNLLLMAASSIYTDLVPNLDSRTFLPVQFGLVVAFLALLFSVIKLYQLPRSVVWICTSLVLIFNLSYALTSWNIINQYHMFGAGYTSKAWHESNTLKILRDLPTNVPLITNESAALLLLIDRPAYDFCSPPCNQSGQLRYGDDPLDPIQKIFRDDGAALIFFYPYCGVQEEPWYADTMDHLKTLTQKLTQYHASCDGAIYFYPSAAEN